MYNKICNCGTKFISKGRAGKYCQSCLAIRTKEIKEYKRKYSHEYKIARGMIINPGSGSGSATGKGAANHRYKHGKYVFETLRTEIKEQRRYCERCNKDLIDATHYMWVVHHKDHDHWNHVESNLELLCKQCHQIEHECWLAFTKVQRLSRKGVASSEAKCVEP